MQFALVSKNKDPLVNENPGPVRDRIFKTRILSLVLNKRIPLNYNLLNRFLLKSASRGPCLQVMFMGTNNRTVTLGISNLDSFQQRCEVRCLLGYALQSR